MQPDILQQHCDEIIKCLEEAVQAMVYAKRFNIDNPTQQQRADEAARAAEKRYFDVLKSLYSPQAVPPIYTKVYKSVHRSSTSRREDFTSESYSISADKIIRQLNDDFLPGLARDFWVSYKKPHLNYLGKFSSEAVGLPNYKISWVDGEPAECEEKTIYLDMQGDGLFYTVLDRSKTKRTGKISLDAMLNLSLEDHSNPEEDLIYVQIEVDSEQISLNNLTSFSTLTEQEEQSRDLQEQSTAIMDRLVDAIYTELYRKYLPKNTSLHERTKAETNARDRYAFYLRTVANLYAPNPVPEVFKRIYDETVRQRLIVTNGNLLRYYIRLGFILSQLNNDFVLKRQDIDRQWLVYNRPYYDVHGDIVSDRPLDKGVYQLISCAPQEDGLTYGVRSPKGEDKTCHLSLDNILSLVVSEHPEHINRPEQSIYVQIEGREKPKDAQCLFFMMQILSHPSVRVVAIALLAVGVALTCAGMPLGLSMALIGGGILTAGLFAPKRRPLLRPEPALAEREDAREVINLKFVP
jgi:hypothetical protein